MTCRNCGFEVTDGAASCPRCNAPVGVQQPTGGARGEYTNDAQYQNGQNDAQYQSGQNDVPYQTGGQLPNSGGANQGKSKMAVISSVLLAVAFAICVFTTVFTCDMKGYVPGFEALAEETTEDFGVFEFLNAEEDLREAADGEAIVTTGLDSATFNMLAFPFIILCLGAGILMEKAGKDKNKTFAMISLGMAIVSLVLFFILPGIAETSFPDTIAYPSQGNIAVHFEYNTSFSAMGIPVIVALIGGVIFGVLYIIELNKQENSASTNNYDPMNNSYNY